MNFLFINLAIDCGYTGVNHGIAWLVPVVRRFGYTVSCLHLNSALSDEDFRRELEQHRPDIIGFSATSHQLKFLAHYSLLAAKFSSAMQLAGGVASTLDPEWILQHSAVQGTCVGEGEGPLADLLARLADGRELACTPGFWWRKAAGQGDENERRDDVRGEMVRNAPPPFSAALEKFENPDYSVFAREIVVSEQGHTFVMLSRGCPYNCFYCCNRALACAYENSHGYFRLLPVDRAIGLVKQVVADYPETRVIEFEDDLLIANKAWFLEFAARYRQEIGLPYRACVRVECVNPEIVEALVASGCRRVLLGLESGNEAFRKEYLNRSYSNDLLVEKARMLRKAGLDLFTFNIVGFPTETPEQMRDTLRLNRRANPAGGVCTFFYPYKHTRLYEIAAEHGLLKSEEELADITNYNTRPGVNMPPETERACFAVQRQLTEFLEHQRLLWRMEQLPVPLPKPLKRFVSPYWWATVLACAPALKTAAQWLYRTCGLKGRGREKG